MNKILSAAVAVLLLLTLILSACSRPQTQDPAETMEAIPIPPITVPDEPDDRTFTETAPYAERLNSLFASNLTAPAADFTYELADDGATITAYTGGEVVVVIPDSVEDKPVVAIGEKAFADKVGLKAISVPDTVKSIGTGAFAGCKSLTSLRTPVFTCEGADYFGALFGATSHEAQGSAVPVGLSTLVLTGGEAIPDYAFYACRALEAVAIPETITEIGDFAFYGCEKLAYIPLGHTVLTAVGNHAFTNCAALLGLDLPVTVESLGFAMLEGCGALESVVLPFVGGGRPGAVSESEADTTYLGYIFGAAEYVFTAGYLPASLITVTLHEGCGDIPANAFFECASLREIVLPEGVTSIGRRAFYGCEKLASVILPDSVIALGDDAYHRCIRLEAFAGGASLADIGVQVFMDCVSLKTVTLPESVTHLPNATFAGCISLETLTANGVKTQGKQVFRHCEKLAGSEWMPYEAVPTETE
ncbi:MAG: leucine-rich repeat domain-containing protein [Clostridia bacterium]|nr:leucine-rich repeat domain-containing protein [Clostridia bacterium]